MKPTLGLPLALAKAQYSAAGVPVETVEARSRKGSGGADARVIRERSLPGGGVQLTYAYFLTEPEADHAK